jgi:hypothetical protein
MTIFVSIAAYRDPELVPTIEDCLKKARWPSQLRFGVCWQHGEGEARPPQMAPGLMRLIDVPYQDSQGACWARAEIMKLYDGEDYFLQLDSHHRFVRHWDQKLLRQLELTGAAKPIVSTYGEMFDPAHPHERSAAPRGIRLAGFAADGIPSFVGMTIAEGPHRQRPMRARFLAAGSMFTLGGFVGDAPYDPDLYFMGEEITLAIRAFTRGYDLFHPSEHIIWHEVSGSERSRHWDDHKVQQGARASWAQRDFTSRRKASRFLRSPYDGLFGCGQDRSFADYEAYAGLSFRQRRADPETLAGEEPPLPVPIRPPRQERTWSVRLEFDRETLPPAALDRPWLWYLGFHDEAQAEISRQDVLRPELNRALAAGAGPIVIERRIMSEREPRSWTLWPADRRGRWLDQITGPLDSNSLILA